MVSGAGVASRPGRVRRGLIGLLLLGLIVGGTACKESGVVVFEPGPTSDWPHYGGDVGGTRYSSLTQLDPGNVEHLEVAWTYHTGDVLPTNELGLGTSFQNTPILVGDTLYLCSPRNKAIALNAETGEERWVFDAEVDTEGVMLLLCRGVSYWRDPQAAPDSLCAERIFMGTLDARMIALDAATGRPCPEFGEGGEIDLSQGIGHRYPGEYAVTSPPLILGDRLVTGAMVLDNIRVDAPGGVVRAYDLRTGELRWSWDPLPPGREYVEGIDASGERVRYQRGTTNSWSILSGDAERGLVYVPTGNTAPDYFGAQRGGLDYYSSSIVALSLESGEPVWNFQTVHHDVWDYDVPAQPALFDFPGPSGPIPAVAQSTKLGHVFLLNRENGQPLFPVEERSVPRDGVKGETLFPTQPFPTRPASLHPNRLTSEDAWGITPLDRWDCQKKIESLRYEGPFTPPSVEGWIGYPSYFGGGNWGSMAVDRGRGLLITNTSRMASVLRLIPRAKFLETMKAAAEKGEVPPLWEPQEGTPYAMTRDFLVSFLGLPCSPPPWGTLVAIDLATGELRWEVPLGTTEDLAPFSIGLPLGVPNQGGPIVTASGLVFIAGAMDDYLRAFDVASGEELWRGRLPAGGQATPLTYRVGPESKQFVVIAAGGHALMGTTSGDSVVAFALPD
jgi:quinoprotein glucose dehydrogenase